MLPWASSLLLAGCPSAYHVAVDFDAIAGTAQPLLGVNQGVRPTAGCGGQDVPTLDYTLLYAKAGVTSVRLHDDAIDLSRIYTPAELLECTGSKCNDAGPCLGQMSPPWLEWNPSTTSAASYDYTEADASYDAIVAGGFAPYLRIGESANGPTYVAEGTPRDVWAEVAAEVAGHFSTSPPEFIEIYNEPDGGFWTGPHLGDDAAHGAEFGGFYALVYDAIDDALPSAEIGGSGFFRPLAPTDALNALNAARASRFSFVSVHAYPSAGTAVTPKAFVTLLDAARDLACGFPGDTCAPLHITEWNRALANTPPGDNCLSGGCVDMEAAAFLSAGLTCMQQPELGIARAHWYSGRNPSMGLFFGHSVSEFEEAMPGVFDWNTSEFWNRTGLDVARSPSDVSASASRAAAPETIPELPIADTERLVVVVTNYGADSQRVGVTLEGLAASASYHVSSRRLTSFPAAGAFVDAGSDGAPVASQVDTVWDDAISEGTFTANASSSGRVYLTSAALPGYTIARYDLVR